MNIDTVAARLKTPLFENVCLWMYKDSVTVITVGCGHAMRTLEDALKLSWVSCLPNATYEATPADVTKDYNALVALTGRVMAAKYYEPFTSCRLTPETSNKVLHDDITAILDSLISAFPPFESFPEPAQEAFFDIAYNVGVHGFLMFKKMIAAAQRGDWNTAAIESNRPQVSADRNLVVFNLLSGVESA